MVGESRQDSMAESMIEGKLQVCPAATPNCEARYEDVLGNLHQETSGYSRE